MIRGPIIFVLLLLWTLQVFMQLRELLEDNQLTQVESGFEKNIGLQLISSNYLFMAILFVFFDVEVLLILITLTNLSIIKVSVVAVWYLLISFIVMSLVLEWKQLGLKWSY